MNDKKLFMIKHNSKVFEPSTLVYCETCSTSGNCYLVSDINNKNKREWIMYYDLYKVDMEKNKYDEKFDKIVNDLLVKK